MADSSRRATVIGAALFAIALQLHLASGHGQESSAALTAAEQASAQRIADEGRVLTVFDRTGNVVTSVGERAIYNQPVFSPDGTKIAVIKQDLESRTRDLWVLDVSSGSSTQITSNETRAPDEQNEAVILPAWSPDGSELVYQVRVGASFRLYRQASDGREDAKLLYEHPGAIRGDGLELDWSPDGRFLTFSTTDLSGGILYTLPLEGDGPRAPIEIMRSESQIRGLFLSPDSRLFAYSTTEPGKRDIHVRRFDSQATSEVVTVDPSPPAAELGRGPAFWRQDGRELYYLDADLGVVAVEVSADDELAVGPPRVLFRPPVPGRYSGGPMAVSRDGERIVMAIHPSPWWQQITVFDREGQILSSVGEPGIYAEPALSPDGTRVAVVSEAPGTRYRDIWVFDLATGASMPITNDSAPDSDPVWSPDGSQLAFVSRRGAFNRIYRKAADGTGDEERLFEYTPGAALALTDWSSDGRFLAFHDGCWGLLYLLPLRGEGTVREPQPIEWLSDEFGVALTRFSPDSKYIAYLSDETEHDDFQVYVSPFDAAAPEAGVGGDAVRLSAGTADGMIVWRRDGGELYYLTPDRDVMAVELSQNPALQGGTPNRLFRLPGPVNSNVSLSKNVSADGSRFVFALNVPVTTTAP